MKSETTHKKRRFPWAPLLLVAVLAFLFSGAGDSCARRYKGPRHTRDVTEKTFPREVTQSKGLVAVDFWATWCGPCRSVEPILESLAAEYSNRVTILKLDVDQNPKLADAFQIRSIPAIYLFKDGKPVDLKIGAMSRRAYKEWFDEHLN